MKNLLFYILFLLSVSCATITTIGKSATAKDYPPGTLIYINISDNIMLKPIPEVPNNYSAEAIKNNLYNEIKSTINLLNGKVVDELPGNCDNCYEIRVVSLNIGTSKSTKKHTDVDKGYKDYPYPYYTSDLQVNVELHKTQNNEKLTEKVFYVKSYSTLQTSKLPAQNQLKNIDEYVTRPKYDFKELSTEAGQRIAYWGSKKLNNYLEKQPLN